MLIGIDGGIGPDTIGEASAAGADLFVVGSSIFGEPDYGTAISSLHHPLWQPETNPETSETGMSIAIVIRPGETDFDQQSRIQGALGLPLTTAGQLQVEETIGRSGRNLAGPDLCIPDGAGR